MIMLEEYIFVLGCILTDPANTLLIGHIISQITSYRGKR